MIWALGLIVEADLKTTIFSRLLTRQKIEGQTKARLVTSYVRSSGGALVS